MYEMGVWLWMTMMMEAVRICETSVSFYETARRNIPEGCLHE
jgi:hypothetical protein